MSTTQMFAITLTVVSFLFLSSKTMYIGVSNWFMPKGFKFVMKDLLTDRYFFYMRMFGLLMLPMVYFQTMWIPKITAVCLVVSIVSGLLSRYALSKVDI